MILSIITLTLNSEDYLNQCLTSTKNICDNNVNIEHIVFDGGSSDKTYEIAKSFSHIKFINSGGDNGIYDALNKSIKFANGYYILFLNSDDFLNESVNFSDIISVLISKPSGWITGHVNWVNKDNELIKSDNTNRNLKFYRFLINNTIRHPSTFVQKEILEKNPFDVSYRFAADYKFFLKIWSSGILPKVIPYHISNFRIWNKSMSFNRIGSLKDEFLVRKEWRLKHNQSNLFLFFDLIIFWSRFFLIKIKK